MRNSFLAVVLMMCAPGFMAHVAVGQSIAGASRTATIPQDSSLHIADQIVASKIPVLVDFWAPWCAPCHMLSPTIKKVKTKYTGKVTVMKVNIDIHKRIAGYFGVVSIPTVVIIKDRTLVSRIDGVRSEAAYVQEIERVLAMPPIDTTKLKKEQGG